MNKSPCCSECGRPFPKPKPPAAPTDTAAMTDAQIHAHYKKISHIEDLKFHARTTDRTSSPELLMAWHEAQTAAPTLPAAENKRKLASLLRQWREERAENERIAGIPALGSPAWFEQIKAEEPEDPIDVSE